MNGGENITRAIGMTIGRPLQKKVGRFVGITEEARRPAWFGPCTHTRMRAHSCHAAVPTAAITCSVRLIHRVPQKVRRFVRVTEKAGGAARFEACAQRR